MAIAGTAGAAIVERIGGADRRLILRNGEIERFEAQYSPFGIFDLWARFVGDVDQCPQARHCRDLLALALVGGGMSDRAADDLVASLPPSANGQILGVASRVLAAAFVPVDPGEGGEKKTADGSPDAAAGAGDTMPPPASTTLSE